MPYPPNIREPFSQIGGLNLLLVKTNRKGVAPTQPPNPIDPGPSYCVGATNQVKVLTSYRGSDWGAGIDHAIRIGNYVYNPDHEFKLYSTNNEYIQVGPYRLHLNYLDIDTPVDSRDNRTILTIAVEPTLTGEYIEVTLVSDPTNTDGNDNTIVGVIGGGQITYGNYLIDGSTAGAPPTGEFEEVVVVKRTDIGAKFCLKPNTLPPLNCEGAGNKIIFVTGILDNFGNEQDFNTQPTYRIHVDGVDYGVVIFSGIKEHQFGDVRIKSETMLYPREDGSIQYRADQVTIIGGVIGVPHKVKIESIPSLTMVQEGRFYAHFDMTGEDGGGGNPTVIIDGNIVQVCLAAVGRCYRAPADMLLFVQDGEREVDATMTYRLVVDDVDYGVVDLLQGGHGIPSMMCGEWDIGFSPVISNEIMVSVTNGYKGSPVHFKLIPVAGGSVLFDLSGYIRPTLVYDDQTGIIEFCIERTVAIECAGATRRGAVGLNAAYTVEDTQIGYTVQISSDGFFKESQATLSSTGGLSWDHANTINWTFTKIGVDPEYGTSSYYEYLDIYASEVSGVNVLHFNYNTPRDSDSVIRITLIPEAGYEDLFQVADVPSPNNSTTLDPDTGIVTFCIVGLAGL